MRARQNLKEWIVYEYNYPTYATCESNKLVEDDKNTEYATRLVVRGYVLRKSHNGARRGR